MTKTPIIIIFQILITTTFEYDETCNRYSCQSSLSENICSFVNNINTHDGGTHEERIRLSITRVI